MRKVRFTLLLISLIAFTASNAQQSTLSTAVQQFNSQARKLQAWNNTDSTVIKNPQTPLESGVRQYLEKFRNNEFLNHAGMKAMSGDSMLIIGATPGDSLIVTGEWLCKVDILVYGDGILRFKNAHATILGNVYAWGANAEITADSSTLYIPQLYFYQRSILAVGAGKVKFNHVTLDFSGLSHNIIATDSSSIEFNDVDKVGFTTNGVYDKAKYTIDGTNLAGEFVIGDQCQLDFRNAKTVLLWHEVPQNGVFHFNFPAAGAVASYNFNPGLPGIENIGYQIKLENCTDVMWALMPSDGSDVDIMDSEIRAIGLWFLRPDSVAVNGLVNNSDYTDYTASLSDRTLRLRNCSVKTWSLYPMKQSLITVNGCILGEIGAMGTSQVQTNSVFVDGSGGYFSAHDTAYLLAFATPVTTYVRSENNGVVVYAYSTLNFGMATALGNSILLAIQSALPEEPVAYDNASVWNVNMLRPSSGNSNSIVPVIGYAVIDRTPTSLNSDMAWYQMFYSVPENDSLVEITPKITTEKRNDTLAMWNTSGMKPGQYLLHLFVSDNSTKPVIVEAVHPFSLNPGVFGIEEPNASNVKVYPNPVSEIMHIDAPWPNSTAILYNCKGAVTWKGYFTKSVENIDMSAYPPGLYVLKINHENGTAVCRIIKE